MTTKTEKPELDALVKMAVDKVQNGSIKLSDLLDALAPAKAEDAGKPEVIPVPQAITEKQSEALVRVGDVFGKVVPTERRKLTPNEVAALADEKNTLDEIKKMAETRHSNIRVTIFNHLDVEAEEAGQEGPRAKDGHYVLPGEVRGNPDTPHKFVRQISNGSATVDLAKLEELAADPDNEFTHKDFLAVTSQTRYLDENKLMLALRKNPRLILALNEATSPGGKTASMYLRKA